MLNRGQSKLIYTLGTSGRSREEFIDLLANHGVEVVLDVRRFPTSRFNHFKREKLAGILAEAGIKYVYMGEELGGFRRGGYLNFMAKPEFEMGLKNLEGIASEKRAAIICAERFPWRCHRRFISLELEKKGWLVDHIIDRKRVWRPLSTSPG